MTRHVIALAGSKDPYVVATSTGGADPITLRFNSTERKRLHEDSMWTSLSEEALTPPQIAVDFYRVAAAVFSADLRSTREGGFDGWQRSFMIHMPVQEPALWSAAMPLLKKALEFLSGDTWSFQFRKRAVPGPVVRSRFAKAHRTATKVCLVSGGLDSFVGAVDQIAAGCDLICVSHNAAGSAAFSSPAQDRVIKLLRAIRTNDAVSHVKASVSPPISISSESEPTQRSRSIMFLGIGVLVAAAASERAGKPIPLVIPENGFISLNVPLTGGRLGSLSTRTTHPYFIECLKSLLGILGIGVDLETPYRYVTKGQMIVRSADRRVVDKGARETVSCAHPSVRRFNASKRNHCGYCVPCIIRRAAMRAAGLDDPRDYTIDVTKPTSSLTFGKSRDLTAFKIALAHRTRQSARAAVLSVAPLPGGPSAIANSIAVYEAGLDEVAELL